MVEAEVVASSMVVSATRTVMQASHPRALVAVYAVTTRTAATAAPDYGYRPVSICARCAPLVRPRDARNCDARASLNVVYVM